MRAHAPFFAQPTPRVFAHRGLATSAPENTLAAFSAALDAGAGYLESDVRATRDGIAVLTHDADLARLGAGPVRIAALSFEELSAIRIAGHRIPSLAEALARFPSARFNLDLKSDDSVEPAVAAILDAEAITRVLVGSFDERRRVQALRALPGVATSASKRGSGRALAAVHAGLPWAAARALDGVHAVQLPESHRGIPVVTPRTIRGFHRAGVEVHVWTVNAESDMRRLLDWGVDGIVTDRADVAVSLIRGTGLST